MTQTVPATAQLGPGKTGLAIGYRVLDIARVQYSAFTTTNVAETGTAGTYSVAGGVVCPNAGGYIVWGTALVDYAEATVESTSANVTLWKGEAPSDLDNYGNVPANLKRWRDSQPAALDSGGSVLAGINDIQEAAQQQVRDALMLAASAGDPAAGSIDAHLDTIIAAGLTADDVLDEVVEGTYTLRQMMRIVFAALVGKSTGGGSTGITFRDVADAKARITATVDADGNRTVMTLDGA